MKQFLIFTLAMCSFVNVIAQNIQPLSIGSSIPKPETKMKSIDGKEYAIKEVIGKNGVLVMFSCNTCPFVVRYQSRTISVLKAARTNGFGVIIINSNEAQRSDEDSYTAMQNYAKAHGYKEVPYVMDKGSRLADAFGASRTPECFLFNASGKLVYHGAIDDSADAASAKQNFLQTAISETISGKEVTVKETHSVGCMIKRV